MRRRMERFAGKRDHERIDFHDLFFVENLDQGNTD